MPFDPEELLRHTEWMRRLAYSLIFDEQRAEDVVQEAWLTSLEAPPRQAGALGAWLRTVVRNRSLKVLRSESRRRDRDCPFFRCGHPKNIQ